MRPKPCPWCQKEFRIEKLVDHEEPCSSRTEKCSECQLYVRLRDKEDHLIRGLCQMQQTQNRQKEALEKQKAMDDLRAFQEKEEKERLIKQKKLE